MLAKWSLKRKASVPSQVSLNLRVHRESSPKVKTKPCDRPPGVGLLNGSSKRVQKCLDKEKNTDNEHETGLH